MTVIQKINNNVTALLRHKSFNLIAFVIIAAFIVIAYSNTFTSAFHFDDNPAIIENAAIKRFTWDNVVGLFPGTRPVVALSLMFSYQTSRLDPLGWHIFNIAFHIANTYFVFLLILKTLTLPSLKDRYGDRARRMALFGALLFGLHPIQTESVTYIISRSELLATFFYLSTFLTFIKGTETKKFPWYVFAFFTSLFAVGSKEWAVTLPAMLFLYDFFFISDSKLRPVLNRWYAYLLVALPWAFLAVVLMRTKLSGAGFGISGERSITPITYLLTSLNVLWTYIRLLILPINQNVDYGYPIAKTLFAFPTYLSLIGHICVVMIAVWIYVKNRVSLIPFGIAWFYITLSPTQSFVPILDVIFEHRLYLPSIGFIIVFIVTFEHLFMLLERRQRVVSNS